MYLTPEQIKSTIHLTSRQAASVLGVGKTSVNKYRNEYQASPERPVEAAEWSPVHQAQPVKIEPTPYGANPISGGWKTAVILPDPQIGYRIMEDGSLDPFHDERAMNVALQIIAYENTISAVEQVVNLGDFLDLPSQGRFAQEASFARTTQLAIDKGHVFLAQQRAAASKAEIVLIEGNHDRRLQNFVEVNALAAFGLKRANMPTTWPVMSLPFLLRLDELNVKYIDAYPAGKHWIADNLRAVHGNKVRSNGSTAAAYTNDMPHISTIFGHVHRLEIQSKTTFDRLGKIRSMAISPGCLCRVDGAVPSVNGAIGVDGKPAEHWENWQQGVAVVRYKDSGEFFVNLVQIDYGFTVYEGREFTSEV